MTAHRRLLAAGLSLLASLTLSSGALADPVAASDGGVGDSEAVRAQGARLPWRETRFGWENAVTTQTLGVGADYQSRNPSYEMTFRLAPRYYLVDRREQSLSLRADVRLLREFTNSDTTTRRGEWTFADSELSLTGVRRVRAARDSHTDLVLRAPILTFPTSKTSALGGRILGLGAGLGLDHELSLLGSDSRVLLGILLRPRVNYGYQFAHAVVATNDRIDRIRLDSDGRIAASDQLSGSMLPQHQLSLALTADTLLTRRLTLEIELGARYAYRYALPERSELCGVVSTGCAEIVARGDRARWGVSTLFGTSLSYELGELFELSAGYVNFAPQLGADGRRRSALYGPEARVFVALGVALDALYQAARSHAPSASAQSAQVYVAPEL